MFRAFLLIALTSLSLTSHAAVWIDTNQWTPEWENEYSTWVQGNWNIEFFARKTLANGQSNPYYGLRVDCADTVYSMRAIFAYEHRLPFVVNDPTAMGKLLSHRMGRWDAQNQNVRIRSFLTFLYDMMSTRSLPNDTYPVAISRQTIRPGTLMMTTKQNHHSWCVKDILSIGVPYLVYNSTVGKTTGTTLQQRQSWPNPMWVFETNSTVSGNAGFRNWRSESDLQKPVWQVQGYSEEQYKIPLKSWVDTVQKRLAVTHETDVQKITRLTKTACEAFQGRVSAVGDGLNYLNSNPRSCMDYATYDTYSTPNRDQRLFDDIMSLRQSYQNIMKANNGRELSALTVTTLNKVFPAILQSAKQERSVMQSSRIDSDSLCVVEYVRGQKMDLAEFKRRLFLGRVSNNPHDTFEYRWGEVQGSSMLAKRCQSWDIWTPDLNEN
jgi:ribosomal protein L39E